MNTQGLYTQVRSTTEEATLQTTEIVGTNNNALHCAIVKHSNNSAATTTVPIPVGQVLQYRHITTNYWSTLENTLLYRTMNM